MPHKLYHKPNFIHAMLIQFNNVSLRRKIMLSYFLLVFLLVGILAVTIYTFTSSSIRKQNDFSLKQGFDQGNSYLTYKFGSIDSSSDMIIYNATINAILNQPVEDYPIMNQIADSKTILRHLKNLEENDDIKRARIYVPDDLLYSDNGSNIRSFSQAKTASWWEPLFKDKGVHLFVGNDSLEDSSNSKQYISLIRAMYQQANHSELAFILRLDIPLNTVKEILTSSRYTSDSITLLIDKNGNIIANSSNGISNLPFLTESGKLLLPKTASEELVMVQDSGEKYMLLHSPIPKTGFQMVTFVPYASFNLAITSLIRTIVCVSLLVLLLAFALSKPIANTITKRIDALCEYMQQTNNGILQEVPDVIYKDEIGVLYENYNYMIGRIRNLMSENYRIGRDLKSAEYKALQSQINPHFLYNTLDMISWLSYQNKSEEIGSVVHSLANFYKLSLNKGNDIVPINDEINHVSNYIKIQDLRFSGNIQFVIQIPPVILQFSIPKITLQPIVENAMFHGILEKPSRSGTITLHGKLMDETILLTIEDDGIGIPSEQLNSLLLVSDSEQYSEDGGSHYGLKNINKRIKLRYGEEYGLSFEGTLGKGTMVHVLLPALHVDELI